MASEPPLVTGADRRLFAEKQRRQLLRNELIADALRPSPESGTISADEINRKYDRGEIRIVTEQGRYPLASISDMLKSGNYKLDPDYQRRHRWDTGQRSRLIESFIMNVPVPPIFLYEWDYNEYEVMDGLQRMTAVEEFYRGGFALTGLEYWTELEGMRYADLPTKIRAGIDRRYISSIILLKETSHGDEDPELLKRFVFGRINTGGVHLSAQELRNALYDGPMNRLCKELAESATLRKLWGIPENVDALVARSREEPEPSSDDSAQEEQLFEIVDIPGSEDDPDKMVPESWRKMVDVELVLRFFANRQRMIHYRDNLRRYLDDYLNAANKYDPETIDELRALFISTISYAEQIFGERAFRRFRGKNWTNVPSIGIYDALMNVLSRMLEDGPKLVESSAEIQAGLEGFYGEHSKVFNLRGQTRTDLMLREILIEEYLRSFIND